MNLFAFVGLFLTVTVTALTGKVCGGVNSPVPVAAEPIELQKQRDQLLLENQISDETLRRELAGAAAESARLKSESELQRARLDRELMMKRAEIEKTRLEMEELSAQLALETARRQAEMQTEIAEL